MTRARARLAAAIVVACLLAPTAELSGQSPDVRGSWHAERYALVSGEEHVVRGQIHFTATDWVVLFFVMDGEEPARGSGEGGRYTLEGDRLTFEHLQHLSAGAALPGLPAAALRMEARAGDGPREPARVSVEGDRLTLFFPSGNRMMFRRGDDP